ncbi:hypothetical protein FDF74_12035 [Clostridium niameyense]|uniref:Uncharacterized protein n=1 Tax=Clostridium niameyense TaxID=1622073 RepID=A0A6M0RDJ5_9CLOT|nr:hypothetical protein [Clostridium niameyense]NEZ47910.1 hypothetical protein [Clostridium niameyense]
MFKYKIASEEIKEKLLPYMNKGEKLLVSDKIEFKGSYYREVLFNKKFFIGVMEETKGIIYIDDNFNIINKINVQNQLIKLGYYYEILFETEKGKSIFKAMKNDEDLKKDKNDIDMCLIGLDILKNEKIENTEKIKKIILDLIKFREEENEILLNLYNLVNSIWEQDGKISEESLKKVYDLYKKLLRSNFKNIKNIYIGADYYDYIKDMTNKKRKSFSIRLNKKISEPLFKLDYEMNYFKKLLKTYNRILNMNENEYFKFIEKMEKNNITERIKIIRNKK